MGVINGILMGVYAVVLINVKMSTSMEKGLNLIGLA